MTKLDSREALLAAGADFLREGGYEYAGTIGILQRAGVPRGSFYHHFGSKREFALAVAERWYEEGARALEPILADPSRPPLARLRAYFEAVIAGYVAEGCERGCLLGMLGQELAGRDDDAARTLDAIFGRWRHRLALCLREAQERGELDPAESPEQLAGFLIDAWEGALIQMKARRSDAPLRAFLDVVFRKVLA